MLCLLSSFSEVSEESQSIEKTEEKTNEKNYTDKVKSCWRDFLFSLREMLSIRHSKSDISYIHDRYMAFLRDNKDKDIKNTDGLSGQNDRYLTELGNFRENNIKYEKAISESLFKLMFEVSKSSEDKKLFLKNCIGVEKNIVEECKSQSKSNNILERLIIKTWNNEKAEKKVGTILNLIKLIRDDYSGFSVSNKLEGRILERINNIFENIIIQNKMTKLKDISQDFICFINHTNELCDQLHKGENNKDLKELQRVISTFNDNRNEYSNMCCSEYFGKIKVGQIK